MAISKSTISVLGFRDSQLGLIFLTEFLADIHLDGHFDIRASCWLGCRPVSLPMLSARGSLYRTMRLLKTFCLQLLGGVVFRTTWREYSHFGKHETVAAAMVTGGGSRWASTST
ncbi:hypothetical protein C8035_v006422 [Colletotrichum spinosum]|uniref:Uncharacterized protein n=1 Tax=Colletotrichum spinosum TaxID=1347390 RepID=A0A4R8QMU9_9PEZI|nr:hypothetical protein C8035_v006422 [Colletotrichum spinosum]